MKNTGETFTTKKTDRKKAYQEFLNQKEVDELIEGSTNLQIN